MDGLNLKIVKSPLEGNFTFDDYGALIPSRDSLRMEKVARRVTRQLKADTGLYRKLTDMYSRTDVDFTDNPAGNTPTLGAGLRRYGKRPLNVSFKERLGNLTRETPSITARLKRRERKIVADQREIMNLYESLKPASTDDSTYVQYLVEGDQMMTGGGFDNNKIGDVQKSAMLFVEKGNNHVEFGNNQFSQLVVEGSLLLRDELQKAGLVLGSLAPVGCSEVRMEQDNDGLIGFPIYDHGWKDYSKEVATRLLIDSGVDSRALVGASAVDPRTGESRKTSVIQGIAYVLDNLVISDPSDLANIVTLLARIQKHGWKEENGELVPKKSKTRSVYPLGGLCGIIEAMVGTPINRALIEHKVSFIPSLQDKPTRVALLKPKYEEGRSKGYEWLSLDESQYDATVIGGAFATMMYYTFRPFFNAKWYNWFDMAIYTLTYKYILCDTSLCSVNEAEFQAAKKSGPWVEVKPFTIFGMTDGLVSGAKLTHIGGSFYGGAVIHYTMPKMMGFAPFLGVQAGDDCVWAYPRDRVDFTSMENTYGPVEEAAKAVGLDINKTKQIWHVVKGELVNVFLQDVYHQSTNTWGVGSIFRPRDAVFFSERDKGLSIAEQLSAEISRMEQGYDSAFVREVVADWLNKEQFIGLLFKEFGEAAFDKIVTSAGASMEEMFKRIDVGSFNFAISAADRKNGSLRILPIIAEVSSSMTFETTLAEALKALGEEPIEALGGDDQAVPPVDSTPDIGDTDDILAD